MIDTILTNKNNLIRIRTRYIGRVSRLNWGFYLQSKKNQISKIGKITGKIPKKWNVQAFTMMEQSLV